MVSFSASEYDPSGAVIVSELSSSELDSVARRASRVATLDTGAVLIDFGYTDADRDMKIKCKPDSFQLKNLKRLIGLFSSHVMSCRDGLYYGAIQRISTVKDVVTITFLPVEKLS